MAEISDWYGNNNINWGATYPESWWGNANEANSWGIIYPATAAGTIVTADSSILEADSTLFTVDNGSASYTENPELVGTSLSDGFTRGSLLPYWFGNTDLTYYTGGASQLGMVISNAASQTKMTQTQAEQIAEWFSENGSMDIDTWYPVASKFKVVETEADPDTVIHNMTDITGAEVKYILSPIASYDYVVLLKGGTSSPTSSGGRQILTVGEVWNDRDIIKY